MHFFTESGAFTYDGYWAQHERLEGYHRYQKVKLHNRHINLSRAENCKQDSRGRTADSEQGWTSYHDLHLHRSASWRKNHRGSQHDLLKWLVETTQKALASIWTDAYTALSNLVEVSVSRCVESRCLYDLFDALLMTTEASTYILWISKYVKLLLTSLFSQMWSNVLRSVFMKAHSLLTRRSYSKIPFEICTSRD